MNCWYSHSKTRGVLGKTRLSKNRSTRHDCVCFCNGEVCLASGGFYSTVTSSGLQVIALNTILWYTGNRLIDNKTSPSGQFEWLTTQLKEARNKGRKVQWTVVIIVVFLDYSYSCFLCLRVHGRQSMLLPTRIEVTHLKHRVWRACFAISVLLLLLPVADFGAFSAIALRTWKDQQHYIDYGPILLLTLVLLYTLLCIVHSM